MQRIPQGSDKAFLSEYFVNLFFNHIIDILSCKDIYFF